MYQLLAPGDHPREYGENAVPKQDSLLAEGIIPANTGRIPAAPRSCPQKGDHPREYGENWCYTICAWSDEGSSPRIRGESVEQNLKMGQSGIIPANTGRILQRQHGRPKPWDHPREYGENERILPPDMTRAGSSPRIRGEW